jgi:hypothetical protein
MMKIVEDQDKGLMAIDLQGDGKKILRFGRMKYDGKLRLFRSDCVLNLSDFATWTTKKEAVSAAKSLGFRAAYVDRIGSRFCHVWGIRHDHRDHYFLAVYE